MPQDYPHISTDDYAFEIVAIALAFFPYLVLHGPIARIARWRLDTGSGESRWWRRPTNDGLTVKSAIALASLRAGRILGVACRGYGG
jgi:hypothetical protein